MTPVQIDVEGYRLESDEGGGWKLGQLTTRTRGGKRVEVVRKPTYHARLAHALDRLREQIAHESNVTTLEELLGVMRDTRDRLTRAAEGLPPESNGNGNGNGGHET